MNETNIEYFYLIFVVYSPSTPSSATMHPNGFNQNVYAWTNKTTIACPWCAAKLRHIKDADSSNLFGFRIERTHRYSLAYESVSSHIWWPIFGECFIYFSRVFRAHEFISDKICKTGISVSPAKRSHCALLFISCHSILWVDRVLISINAHITYFMNIIIICMPSLACLMAGAAVCVRLTIH